MRAFLHAAKLLSFPFSIDKRDSLRKSLSIFLQYIPIFLAF
jgi:hypothetical protein